MNTITVNCKICNQPFERPIQRGRPALRCLSCRSLTIESPNYSTETKEETKEETSRPGSFVQSVSPLSIKLDEVGNPEVIYQYKLIVTNMGLTHAGDSEKEALAAFKSHADRSSMGFGQIGFEIVRLYKLDEDGNYNLFKEYIPQREPVSYMFIR